MVKSEQESWEEQQIAMANSQFGSSSSSSSSGGGQGQYDYVMDDQIDFISSQILKGELYYDGVLIMYGVH